MTLDEKTMLLRVSDLAHRLNFGKRFDMDSSGLLIDSSNGRSIYFTPSRSIGEVLTWKVFENDGTEIRNKAGSILMTQGWEGLVSRLFRDMFRGRDARIGAIASRLVESKEALASDLALALVRKGMSISEAVIVASTACERCMWVLAHECGLAWGSRHGSDEWEKSKIGCDLCHTGGVK